MSEKLQVKMNEFLADQQVMYIKLHNLHWNVKGNGFFTLHSKLEELYDQTAEVVDEVAERLLAIGARPIGSMQKALELTKISELPDDAVSSEDTVNILKSDIEYLAEQSKSLVELAEETGDNSTADMFNEYLSGYQKLLWMLKAFMS